MYYLCRAHDITRQGAQTTRGLTEFWISADCNDGAMAILRSAVVPTRRLVGRLSERIDIINRIIDHHPATAALEIHCNNFPDAKRTGYFCIVSDSDPEACKLAECILEELDGIAPGSSLGVCRVDGDRRWIGTGREYSGAPPLAFIDRLRCPAVIVEAVHLSNELESNWIDILAHRLMIGEAVAWGMVKYWDSIK